VEQEQRNGPNRAVFPNQSIGCDVITIDCQNLALQAATALRGLFLKGLLPS